MCCHRLFIDSGDLRRAQYIEDEGLQLAGVKPQEIRGF